MADTQAPTPFPESVYDFGAWLKAHPAIFRVKLPSDVYERYLGQIEANAWMPHGKGFDQGYFTWQFRAAAIVESAWAHRHTLFPRRIVKHYGSRLTIAS